MEVNYLKVAKEASLEAGKIIAKYFGKEHKYKYKNQDNSDFATQADLESEQKIVEILTENFPQHSIIAEEGGKTTKTSDYTWVIDPLDGTISFACGMPFFAVSIALLFQGEPIIGVIFHPVSNDLYWAQKGKGTYVNGKRVYVSKRNDFKTTNFALDFGHKARRLSRIDQYIVPISKEVGYVYAIGSAVMSFMLVARGVLDGASIHGWLWDVAAGILILKEAGGKVTDFKGQEIEWKKDRFDVLATNGLIHDKLLKVL